MPDLFRIGTDMNFYRVEDMGIDGGSGERRFAIESVRIHATTGDELAGVFTVVELKAIHANLTDILSRYTDDGHRA